MSNAKIPIAALAAIAAVGLASTADAKFDLNPPRPWDNAGIGAAAMLAVLGAAGASTVLLRNRRGRHGATS